MQCWRHQGQNTQLSLSVHSHFPRKPLCRFASLVQRMGLHSPHLQQWLEWQETAEMLLSFLCCCTELEIWQLPVDKTNTLSGLTTLKLLTMWPAAKQYNCRLPWFVFAQYTYFEFVIACQQIHKIFWIYMPTNSIFCFFCQQIPNRDSKKKKTFLIDRRFQG